MRRPLTAYFRRKEDYMSLREKIVALTREQNSNRQSLVVPEWRETVFYAPLTIKERALIRKGAMIPDPARPGELILDYEMFDVLTVLHKALDREGNPVFTASDREFLESEAAATAVAAVSRAIHGRADDRTPNP